MGHSLCSGDVGAVQVALLPMVLEVVDRIDSCIVLERLHLEDGINRAGAD